MNLTLQLSPETEAKLKEHANLTGRTVEELALEALQDKLSSDASGAPQLSVEEWTRQFDAWVEGLPSRNPHFNDSRESIYPDRG